GMHTIAETFVDSQGVATRVSTTFTGGLELDNGNLVDYVGSISTVLLSGITSYALDPSNGVYTLDVSGILHYAPAGGNNFGVIGYAVVSFKVGSDGSAWALNSGGNLYYYRDGQFAGTIVNGNWVPSASGVQSITLGNGGILYALQVASGITAGTPVPV